MALPVGRMLYTDVYLIEIVLLFAGIILRLFLKQLVEPLSQMPRKRSWNHFIRSIGVLNMNQEL